MEALRTLAPIDYTIIIIYAVACIGLGLYYTRKASSSIDEFFLTGRTMPWWLIGVSMAATNFSVDTPLAITNYVFKEGIAGVWFFWASAISSVLVTFFFATLWRRAKVMTDVEIIEKRYSGQSASFLRGFKGFYFGIVINCFVMGWVLTAFTKVMTGLTDLNSMDITLIAVALVSVYTLSSGLYGVLLTDFIQYGIALFGSIALAYFSVKDVGGIDALISKITTQYGTGSGVTDFVPNVGDVAWMPMSVFLVYMCMQWWAHKYSDGGGKHIQRMSAAKNPRHAVVATFFFTIMNYAVQVWPWIITALCALVIFGRDVADPEKTYVMMIARELPHGVLGLMVVALIAAFMSTMSTHLNLGGSYLVSDIYQRFVRPKASQKHLVLVSRLAMMGLLGISILIAEQIDSVGDAWKFILAFTSGAGLTYIARWIWWRANAWSEIVGMTVSGIVAIYSDKYHPEWLYSTQLCVIVGISTVAWVIATLLTSPVDEARLVSFVRAVRPGMPGWKHIYNKYGIPYESFGKDALINFVLGTIFFFSLNFAIGSLLLHRFTLAVPLVATSIVFALLIWKRLTHNAHHVEIEDEFTADVTLDVFRGEADDPKAVI